MPPPTLVIDWDHTLAHSRPALPGSEIASASVYRLSISKDGYQGPTNLYLRPYAEEFLQAAGAAGYRLALWSYGVSEYIAQCLSKTGLSDYFSEVRTRGETPHMPTPLKDLFLVEEDLTRIAIVDDSNEMFGQLNPYNCIDSPAWEASHSQDRHLSAMLPVVDFHFSYILSQFSAEDLRKLRAKRLNDLGQRRW